MQPGIAYAALAYVLWGLFPLYFAHLKAVPATEVLVHRVVWSLVFVLVLLAWQRRWAWLPALARQPRVLGAFVASALLLSTNWLIYIWAVGNGHVLDASLGYFITPLVNVLLGTTVLKERPRAAQWAALALAACGVLWLTVQAGQLPWIALALAASFGLYGLALETLLLAAPALVVFVLWWGRTPDAFPHGDLARNLWLVGVGPLTAVPLLLFAAGARRIPLTTLGLLQYIGPSIQFVIGVWVFGEPFGAARLVGFALIWLALVLYSADSLRVMRRAAAAA